MSEADDIEDNGDPHTVINSQGVWEVYIKSRGGVITQSEADGCITQVGRVKGRTIGRYLSFPAAPDANGGWVEWMPPARRR